jgi:uncharacterized membrane protein
VRPRLADAGALLTLLASIAMGVFAYGVLPNSLRIHWGGPYYGPEFAPKLLVLALFPVLAGVLFVGLRVIAVQLDRFEEFETVRPIYDWSVVATLLFLVAFQALVVWLNLG